MGNERRPIGGGVDTPIEEWVDNIGSFTKSGTSNIPSNVDSGLRSTVENCDPNERTIKCCVNEMKSAISHFMNTPAVENLILALIIINSIMIGIGTYDLVMKDEQARNIFNHVDLIFLVIFSVEIGLTLFYRGYKAFKDVWVVFDFLIISLSWILSGRDAQSVQTIRALRIFRVIPKIKSLNSILGALNDSLPRLGCLAIFLGIIMFIFAIYFTESFGDLFENGETEYDYFGRLDLTFFTLYQLMSLDEWSTILREIQVTRPYAWIPILIYVILTAFIIVNLVIAIICEHIFSLTSSPDQKGKMESNMKDLERMLYATRLEIYKHLELSMSQSAHDLMPGGRPLANQTESGHSTPDSSVHSKIQSTQDHEANTKKLNSSHALDNLKTDLEESSRDRPSLTSQTHIGYSTSDSSLCSKIESALDPEVNAKKLSCSQAQGSLNTGVEESAKGGHSLTQVPAHYANQTERGHSVPVSPETKRVPISSQTQGNLNTKREEPTGGRPALANQTKRGHWHFINGYCKLADPLRDPMRHRCGQIVNHKYVQGTVVFLIIINSLVLAVGTFKFVTENPSVQSAFDIINVTFLIIYTVENGMQLIVHGLQMFKDGWLTFDFILIALSWFLSFSPSFRVFRVLRIVHVIPKFEAMQIIVRTLSGAVPKIGAITGITLILFYVFGVMFTTLFQDIPVGTEHGLSTDYFSRLDKTFLTLFEIMTMADWAQISRELADHLSFAPILTSLFLTISGLMFANAIVALIGQAQEEVIDATQVVHGIVKSYDDRWLDIKEMHTEITGRLKQIETDKNER